MDRYLKFQEIPMWDAVAVTLKIEDEASTTYYTLRHELKPGLDLIASADSDNGGWSRWGKMTVEEVLPDGIVTSLGELTPGNSLSEDYPNVYPYRDGLLTAELVNMCYEVIVEDPENGKTFTAYIPRERFWRDHQFLEPLIAIAKEYFPEAKGYIKYLESLRPTPETTPIKWDVYVRKNNTCKLAVKEGLYPKEYKFPRTVEYDGGTYQVVDIDGGGEFRSGELEKLSFPKGVKYIQGFYKCTHLKKVDLPSTLEEIQFSAFKECTNLSKIDLPNSVKKISLDAFYGTDISEVTLPKDLEELYIGAFAHTPLKRITIPDNVDKIWKRCFKECLYLVEVNLPTGMKVIESLAFKDCISLKKINIPDGVRYIGEEAFAGCICLQEISLPKYVLLHPEAFKDCPCKITYRETADIPSWKKVKVTQRTWYDKKTKLDFDYTKTYKEMVADPTYNQVCSSTGGFRTVEIKEFNEKYVRLDVNGWDYVFMVGDTMENETNASKFQYLWVL